MVNGSTHKHTILEKRLARLGTDVQMVQSSTCVRCHAVKTIAWRTIISSIRFQDVFGLFPHITNALRSTRVGRAVAANILNPSNFLTGSGGDPMSVQLIATRVAAFSAQALDAETALKLGRIPRLQSPL